MDCETSSMTSLTARLLNCLYCCEEKVRNESTNYAEQHQPISMNCLHMAITSLCPQIIFICNKIKNCHFHLLIKKISWIRLINYKLKSIHLLSWYFWLHGVIQKKECAGNPQSSHIKPRLIISNKVGKWLLNYA